jgi:hypothetical protein
MMPSGAVSVGLSRTSCADDFVLHEEHEWLHVPFDPKWTAADLARRDVRLVVSVPGESILREMRAFDEWIKEQVAARSQELLGRSTSKDEINAEGLYRTPLFSPQGYSPRLEVLLILKGGPLYLTTFSRVNEDGAVETVGTGAGALKRVGHAEGATETEHQWRGSRVQLQVRPERIDVYEDKRRPGTKMFGLKYGARTCRVDIRGRSAVAAAAPGDRCAETRPAATSVSRDSGVDRSPAP